MRKQLKEGITKRFFNENNIAKFTRLINDTNLDRVTELNCPNEAYNYFLSKFKIAFDSAFPEKHVKPNKNYIKQETWVTNELLESARLKNKLLKRKMERPTLDNIENYKTHRNRHNKLKRKIKVDYFKNQINANKHNMKNTWKILRAAINKQNDESSFPQTFLINDTEQTDHNKIATAFNNFYTQIGKSTSENVPRVDKHFTSYLNHAQVNSIFIEPVDENYVLDIVSKLKPKMSSGYDNIPTKLLKQTIHPILTPLTHIINMSLNTGIFPEALKLAKVIPIYKNSEKNLLRNYRPVSLLPGLSKVFEKVMFNKLFCFLNSHDILYKHQYGFRPKHATTHPILHFLNKCAEANNSPNKELTMSIMCDLSKAFDVISHDILLRKLEHYGIRGIAKDWLSSYLTGRKQYVEFMDSKSDQSTIECGVPQGSILGPLLYLIYVNDIANCSESDIYSFADDTTLVINKQNIATLYQCANTEINNLYTWFCANRLSLNAQKTKYVVVRAPSTRCDFEGYNLTINGEKIVRVGNDRQEKSVKFLGVHIDESLNWKCHTNYINKKIAGSLYALRQAKNILPTDCLKTLYYALIQPHISYGLLAWGNSTPTTLNRTILLQKRAVRLISKAGYNSHTDPLFKSLEILKVTNLFELGALTFMHKYNQHKLPFSFTGVYRYNYEVQSNYQTRQAGQIHIPLCRTSFSQKLPLYYFPKLWNHWNDVLPCSTLSLGQLKKRVTQTMLSNYSEHIQCNNPGCLDCGNK